MTELYKIEDEAQSREELTEGKSSVKKRAELHR